jgi:hypothetical protein
VLFVVIAGAMALVALLTGGAVAYIVAGVVLLVVLTLGAPMALVKPRISGDEARKLVVRL